MTEWFLQLYHRLTKIHGQQQNQEQRNSDLYVVAVSTRAHSSAVMGATVHVYIISPAECHGVLDQCAM